MKANIYIKNFGLLMDKIRPEVVAIDVLAKGGLLNEREVCIIARRIGEYVRGHIEIEIEEKLMTPVPKVWEDAFEVGEDG